jgi:hypothetical protein
MYKLMCLPVRLECLITVVPDLGMPLSMYKLMCLPVRLECLITVVPGLKEQNLLTIDLYTTQVQSLCSPCCALFHCRMLSTLHHLDQVQSLCSPCCAGFHCNELATLHWKEQQLFNHLNYLLTVNGNELPNDPHIADHKSHHTHQGQWRLPNWGQSCS